MRKCRVQYILAVRNDKRIDSPISSKDHEIGRRSRKNAVLNIFAAAARSDNTPQLRHAENSAQETYARNTLRAVVSQRGIAGHGRSMRMIGKA